MAHGHERGDYLTQFLNQLPQIYRAKQNIDLQRERLQYMKEEGFKDELYRGEVLTANQRRNQLAKDEFDQRKLKNQQDEEYRNELLRRETLKNSPGAFELYIEQTPLMKDNPQLLVQFKADAERKEDLGIEANRLWGLTPENMVLESRKFLTLPGVTKDQAKTAREALAEGIDRLTMTNEEFSTTESYLEYATLHSKLSNPESWFIAGTPTAQKEGVMEAWGVRMNELRVLGKATLEKGFGLYPDTNVSDDDIDGIIKDFTDIDTEEGIELGKTMGPLFAETDADTSKGESSIQTAGFTLPAIVDSGGTWSKDAVFLEDAAGMDKLTAEYSKTGEATLGPLEKSAAEGSVMMPVSRETFEAVDAGVNILNRANDILYGLTRPAVMFDTHSKAGKKAGKPADWDKKYKEQAEDFKKSLKDMYNLYLRLDPSVKGNDKMREKIANAIIRYKSILKKQGKWEKSYQFDPDIASILRQIQF